MRVRVLISGVALGTLLAGFLGQSAQAVAVDGQPGTLDMRTAAPMSAHRDLSARARVIAPTRSPRGDVTPPASPSWWGLRKAGGGGLDTRTPRRGTHANQPLLQLVVGKRYQLHGRLPANLRAALSGRQMAAEAQSDRGGPWTTVARFTSDSDGRFSVRLRIPDTLLGVHRYRIKATGPLRSARQATVLPGGTLTAVGDVVFSIAIYNDTASDLTFTFPVWQQDSGYAAGSVPVYKRTATTLTFTNPIQDVTQIGFSAQRFSCFFNCQTFNANWDHTPSKKHTPCSTGMPTFTSGSSFTLRVTPQALTSGYDTFMLDSNGNEICTGGLDTKVSTWFGNHPVAKWGTIALVTTVIVIVAWEGIAYVAAELAAEEVFEPIITTEWDEEAELACRVWNQFSRQTSASCSE